MTAAADDGVTMAAALAEALPDPLTEIAYRSKIAREAFDAGRAAGRAEEHERQLAEEAQRRREMASLAPGARGRRFVTSAEIERCRWIVRGEQRTRRTFAYPHPADFPPDTSDAATSRQARWEAGTAADTQDAA
jgi:hypothetical protein